MATALGDMIVKIVGQNAEFDGAIDKSEKKYDKFLKKMKTGGKTLTKFVTLPLLAAAGAAVKFAIDADETAAKFGTAFRDVRKTADETARNLRDNFGLSTEEAQRLLAGTGDLLKGFGASGAEALALSDKVQRLSVDLASYNNLAGGSADASSRITRALLGEREALIGVGVKISEAAIEQERLARGTKDLTGQAKLLADAEITLDLIMAQSKDAMGDFARTSESGANQMRILKARTTELFVTFGKQMLPTVTKLVGKLTTMLEKFANLSDGTKRFIIVSGGIAAALGPSVLGLSKMISAVKILIPLLKILGSPGGLITAAAVALGLFVYQYVRWKKQQEANKVLLNKNNEILYGTKIAINAVTSALDLENAERIRKLELLRAEQELMLNMQLDDLEYAQRAATGNASYVNAQGRRVFITQQEIDANKKAIPILEKRIDLLRQSIDLIDEAIAKGKAAPETPPGEDEDDPETDKDKETREFIAAKELALEAVNNLALADRMRVERQIEAERELNEAIARLDQDDYDAMVAQNAAAIVAKDNMALADIMRAENVAEATAAVEAEITRMTQEEEAARVQAAKDAAARKKVIQQAWLNTATAAISAVQSLSNAMYEAEIDAAGDNDAKIRIIKRNQAKANKAFAIFDIGMKTAQAIVGFLANPGGYAGAALAIAAGGIGLIQAGAVLKQPLPALARGGIAMPTPGGTAVNVAEAGVPEVIFPLDRLGDVLSAVPNAATGSGDSMIHLQVTMDSEPILQKIFPATRNGRILIDARAVV